MNYICTTCAASCRLLASEVKTTPCVCILDGEPATWHPETEAEQRAREELQAAKFISRELRDLDALRDDS